MKTIWEYQFRVQDVVQLEMPPTPYCFRVFGTGHEVTPDVGEFVATFQYGPLVFHIFSVSARQTLQVQR